MAGVFITREMQLSIPAGGLKIALGPDGPAPSLVLHVHFDVCPMWCELAIAHLKTAKAWQADRITAWQSTGDTPAVVEEKTRTLEREFESSLQAIMASAIALDALYAAVQPNVALEEALVKKWRDARTARYSQVTEVVRRAFKLKTNGTKTLRQSLKRIYRLRDLAVHPSGRLQEAILHPELNVGVEWRFAYFRAANAESVVNATTAMLWDLSNQGKPANEKIENDVKGLKARMNLLFPEGHPLVKKHGGGTKG